MSLSESAALPRARARARRLRPFVIVLHFLAPLLQRVIVTRDLRFGVAARFAP